MGVRMSPGQDTIRSSSSSSGVSPSPSGSTRGAVSARGTALIEAVRVSADPRIEPEDDGDGRIVLWFRLILMPKRLSWAVTDGKCCPLHYFSAEGVEPGHDV